MKLSDYLSHGAGKAFAQRVGITPKTLSLYCTGKSVPRFPIAYRISKATDGLVSVEELIPLDEPYSVRVRFRADDPIKTTQQLELEALRLAAAEAA